MKITIIKKQIFDISKITSPVLKLSEEKVFYIDDFKSLPVVPIGERAEKIRVELEFDQSNIPDLLKFLENCEPCFGA